MKYVLDASAFLAYLREEKGADRVANAMKTSGAIITTANLAEVLAKTADIGEDPERILNRVADYFERLGILQILPVDTALALASSQLRMVTRSLGLSLADRICLAVGKVQKLPVLTTDRAWKSLKIGVKIEVIR